MAKNKNNDEKTVLGFCGECGTMSELLKHGFDANLTTGHTKAVDIVVMDKTRTKIKKIEVKTTNKKQWPTSFFQKYWDKNKLHPDYWVCVYVDENLISHYYVLTHDEIAQIQMQVNQFTSWPTEKPKGVDNIKVKMLAGYENRWNIITV